MISRRTFVGTGTLALVGTACTARTGEAAQEEESQSQSGGALPPSIAALKSMKGQATPISVEERKVRLEKARRLMVERKIDALMLAGGTSLVYFTGMNWGNSERFTGVIIPAKGAPFVVTPKFEEERTIEQVKLGPLGDGTDVLTWEEHENPHDRVAQGLKSRGISAGTLGVEETVKWVFSDMASHQLPAMKLTSGTPVTAGCRMVKDAHEIALMKLASKVTLLAYQAAYKAMKEGMTQNDFARLVSQAHDKLGFAGGAGVQVG
ncbi:MAG: aminopeptidase P family N-terminal domain-containing protein, partial [Gemmatimonadaceae bacterium]